MEWWHLFLLLELLLWGELNGAAAIHLALGALEGTLTLQHCWHSQQVQPSKKCLQRWVSKIFLQFETSISKAGLRDEDYSKLKADGPYFRLDKVTLDP